MNFLKLWMQVFGLLVAGVAAVGIAASIFFYLVNHSVVGTIVFILLLLSGFMASMLEVIK